MMNRNTRFKQLGFQLDRPKQQVGHPRCHSAVVHLRRDRWISRHSIPLGKGDMAVLESAIESMVGCDEKRVLNLMHSRSDFNNTSERCDVIDICHRYGVSDILSVVSEKTVDEQHSSTTLGNVAEERVWVGRLESIPVYMGPFQTVILENRDERSDFKDVLRRCSLMIKPGGSVVVVSPCRDGDEDVTWDLCLELVERGDHVTWYKVPDNFSLRKYRDTPIYMEGTVVTGYGRGSAQLGVPTANLSPVDVGREIEGLPSGVYFGWAQLQTGGDSVIEDRSVHKMVMNIGKRPTFVKDNGPDVSVEAHVMHTYQGDFYGKKMKVILVGYLRPEMKFDGLDALLRRIQTDIGISKSQLDSVAWRSFADDAFFD
jgi:riboflavin kinase